MLQRNGSYGSYHNPTAYSYRVSYGVVPPALPSQDQAKPYVFGESSIQPFRSFGITPPPPAPTNNGNSIFFGEATTQPTPKFGITPPVLPVERTQVNVPPSIPTLPVPQYNVPNQPLQYPETYNAGDFPIPQRPDNPITYFPGTYPQPSNQPLPVPNFPVPTAPNNPITYFPGTYPQPMPRSASEVNSVIGDMNASMMAIPQLETLAQQQMAIQQNYYQQSHALLMAQNSAIPPMPTMPSQSMASLPTQNPPPANSQATSSGSLANVDYSKLPKDSVEGVKKYGAMIAAAEKKYGIPSGLLFGLIRQESKFNSKIKSPVGAGGLGQLMPATAKSLGVTDVNDPAQNIEGSAKYLAQRLKDFNGDVTLALAAYNAGIGNVKKHGGVPPFKETQHYVKVVQENQRLFQNAGIK